MNTKMIQDGSLTEAAYAALRAADEAVAAAKRHQGGRLARWSRLMGRNSYTIDPVRPEPDEQDEALSALGAAAAKAVQECIDGGALTPHDARVRGWM